MICWLGDAREGRLMSHELSELVRFEDEEASPPKARNEPEE